MNIFRQKMKEELALLAVREVLLQCALTFKFKVISVIWIAYCHLHPIGNQK